MDRANHKDSCRVLVFAKAPETGDVKTLLIPLLGAEGAAALQQQLVKHALTTAVGAKVGAVERLDHEDPAMLVHLLVDDLRNLEGCVTNCHRFLSGVSLQDVLG